MADLSDVENALVFTVENSVYPWSMGTYAYGVPSPLGTALNGAVTKVFRGWPVSSKLDQDLRAGIVNISVFSPPNATTNTTRFKTGWQYQGGAPIRPSLTVTGTLTQALFTGKPAAGQLAGVRLNRQSYVYAVKAADTPSTVAAGLAALVPGATASGTVLSVPYAPDFVARVVVGQAMVRETRRQRQLVHISFWAPSPAVRDVTVSIVDAALAPIEFLPLADGTGGRLIYRGTRTDDAPSKAALWCRNLQYTVEYPTIETKIVPAMLFGIGNLTADHGGTSTTIQ